MTETSWEWGVFPDANRPHLVMWSTTEDSARNRFAVYSRQAALFPRVALVRRPIVSRPIEVVERSSMHEGTES